MSDSKDFIDTAEFFTYEEYNWFARKEEDGLRYELDLIKLLSILSFEGVKLWGLSLLLFFPPKSLPKKPCELLLFLSASAYLSLIFCS